MGANKGQWAEILCKIQQPATDGSGTTIRIDFDAKNGILE